MKSFFCTSVGIAGAIAARLLGGWDDALLTMMIFMGVDYLLGVLVAARGRSPKSGNGRLSSKAGFWGLVRKGIMASFVLVGHRLDVVMGVDYVRTAVIYAFLANELLSIIENAGLLGVPMPAVITNTIDILKKKGEHGQ